MHRLLIVAFISTFAVINNAQAREDWTAPETASATKNPVATSKESLSASADLYDHRCWKCHGDNGEGDGPKAEDLSVQARKFRSSEVQAQTDGALFWKIQTGKKPMPKYGEKLSDEEIWGLVNLIRTFKSNADVTKPKG